MFKGWLIGAIIAFLLSFSAIIYCSSREKGYPFWYNYLLAFAVGCGVSVLSWLGVLLILMVLSVSRND